MKKLFFSLLILVAASLNGYTIEDLEQKIIESNTEEVQAILKTIQINLNDHNRLLILANDIMQQRKTKYEAHFIKPNSLAILFEFSKEKIITFLAGLVISIAGVTLNLIINSNYTRNRILGIFQDITINTPYFNCQFIDSESLVLGLLGGSTILITFLQHFYDIKKLYDNSIKVKQLVCKATITSNN